EALRTGVAHAVVLASRRAHQIARPDGTLLRPDADAAGARHDVVELVADGVAVSGLLLPRLGAAGVAEEATRVDEADLLHLVGGERETVRDADEVLHRALLARPGRRRKSLSGRGAGRPRSSRRRARSRATPPRRGA